MTLSKPHVAWLALGAVMMACAPETPSTAMTATPAFPQHHATAGSSAAAPIVPVSMPVAKPAATPPVTTAQATPPAQAPVQPPAQPAAAPAAPVTPAAPATPPAPAPGNREAPMPAQPPAAGPGAATPPAASPGGGGAGEAFCAKYEMHCKYGGAQRHADKAACMADFNATPIQQGCKNMHMDTAIAGTAAACNGMPSEFCFAIHCLHAAGIVDQTGVTYCK